MDTQPDKTEAMQKVETASTTLTARVLTLEVTNNADYEIAGTLLKAIKGARKQVKEAFGPVVKKAHEAWKAAKALENSVDGPLVAAENTIKPKIAAYATKIEREAQAAQRAADEEARQAAETERIAQAAAYEKAGEAEAATAVLAAPIVPVSALAQKAPAAPVAGVHTRDKYSAEVYDVKALCKAVADGTAALSLVKPNQMALDQMARALKGNLTIPGVRVHAEKVVSSRSS